MYSSTVLIKSRFNNIARSELYDVVISSRPKAFEKSIDPEPLSRSFSFVSFFFFIFLLRHHKYNKISL
jgi:Trk-type K+ transport system membrane component